MRWPPAYGQGRGGDSGRLEHHGLTMVKITYKGSSNFVVHAYGDYQELLVNEIGRYSGEVLLPDGRWQSSSRRTAPGR